MAEFRHLGFGLGRPRFRLRPRLVHRRPRLDDERLPGSRFRARVIDRSGDIQESTAAEAPYVGTLHDAFDVNLFNNGSLFASGGGATPKTSGTRILAANSNSTWLNSGSTNGNWNQPTNWVSGVVPGATVAITGTNADTSVATFNTAVGTFGTTGSPVVIDSASENIKGITFDTAAGNYFIGTTVGNPIYLSSTGLIQILATLTATNAVETINAPLVIEGASGTYSLTNNSGNGAGAGAGTLKFGGQISGGASGTTTLTLNGTNTNLNTVSGNIVNGSATNLAVTKSGAGTWVLSGTNSYSGTTLISAGLLSLTGTNSSSGATTVSGSAGTILALGAGTNGGLASGTLTLSGSSRIESTDSTSRTISNSTVVTANTAIFGNGSPNNGLLTFNGTIDLQQSSNTARTISTQSDVTFANAVFSSTGTNVGLTKTGSGTLTFSGSAANTYDGTTAVSNGELDLNKSGVNAIAGNLTIGDGTATDTVKLLAANQIADTSDVTMFATGTPVFNLNGNNETIDALNSTNTAASITLGAGTLTVGANNEGSFAYAGASSGTGGITKTGSGILTLSGANAYTGDTTIAAGRLLLSSNGSLASNSRIRLGDTIANSPTAGFTFGASGGGITLSNPMTVQASSSGTQGTRTLSGTAVNGNTNTYSGVITLNTGLLVQSASSGSSVATTATAGILLFQTGSIDFGTSALTVNSNVDGNNADTYSAQGTVRLNGALTSSNATGGSIVKDGSGTLIIQSTGNTYTGSTGAGVALNTNGTRIGGGILGIFGDTSLGIAPATSANNVFFTTSALNQNVDSIQPTLRADANNITLAATRNINIASGVTGRIDSNGNTFTIAGVINGSGGNLNKIGAGTLVLTGANTYTGTTTISNGTLNAAANGALGSGTGGTAVGTSGITVNSGGTLMLTNSAATDRVRSDAPIILGSGGSATISTSGSGNVSEGTGAQVTNGGLPSGSSTIGLGSLTLQSNSTIDFSSLSGGTLTFASFSPGTFTLNILNWTSSASFASLTSGTDGVDDRLIFGGGAPPNTAFITFNGTPAAFIPLDTGFYEVVPIPETSTWIGAALALGAIGVMGRGRFRKKLKS